LQWTISPESVKVQDLLFLGRYYIEIEVLSIVENRLLKGEVGIRKWECGSRKKRKVEKKEGGKLGR
jgi:hypothetical protein